MSRRSRRPTSSGPAAPDAEITALSGGQPVYYHIVAIE